MAEATQVFVGTHAMRVWRGHRHCRWAQLFEMEVLFHFVHWWQDQHNTAGATVDCTSLTMVSCKVVSIIALESNNSFLPFLSGRVYTGTPILKMQNLSSHTHILSLSVPLFLKGVYSILLERHSIWTMNYTEYLLLTALLQISMKTQQPTVASGFELTDAIS